MAHEHDLATALHDAAVLINRPGSTSDTLAAIVHACTVSMVGIDHAGITLVHRDGRLETAAASDDLVRTLDRLQYEAGEGPCLTALEDDAHPVTVVEHAGLEERWHAFIPAAVERGLRSQLGVRLFGDHTTIGVLNLYSTSSDTVSDDTRQLAELFATHAALAYGHSRVVNDLRGAIGTRQIIGQATGIVMERYALDSRTAFEYLVRVCSSTETKMRDLAAALVAAADTSSRTVGPH